MRDGLNSSILPSYRGASGGKGLPPRTHAIHTALFRTHPRGLTLEELAGQLREWGYEAATADVTRNHLESLYKGWGAGKVVAAVKDTSTGRYSLTTEGYSRLASGAFSDALQSKQARATTNELDGDDQRLDSRRKPPPTPRACDADEPPPRIETTVYRILRDSAIARQVKVLHDFKCQLCGGTILLAGEVKYAECHHIKPLGGGHDGLDEMGNVLCVCPNHHVLLDYGAIKIQEGGLRTVPGHVVKSENIQYHNKKIHGKLR